MSDAIQRKLTTIFYADVCGFSRLMEADEEATLQTLRQYRQAMTGFVERHHGRVVNTAGDSVLAEFASVVEALQCAAEVQRELRARNADVAPPQRMEFRIGLNLGDVMVEGDDLYGEGVNVAARLQALAEPGGICISGTVYDQVHNKLTLGYDFIGEQSVKNIIEPVPAYAVHLEAGRGGGARRERTEEVRRHAAAEHRPVPLREPAPGDVTWARRVYVLFLASVCAGLVALLLGVALNAGDDGDQTGKIDGDVAFSQDTDFRGKIDGDVVVAEGVTVRIAGKVDGDVTIEPGARLTMRGKIEGDVVNRGGAFRIIGKLEGSERYEPAPGAPSTGELAEAEALDGGFEGEGPTWRQVVPALFLLGALGCALVGLIAAYIHRGDGGAWTDSHYTFQVRTFWIGLLALAAGGVLSLLFVGLIVLLLLPLWLLVRSGRGLRYQAAGVAHPHPQSWLFG